VTVSSCVDTPGTGSVLGHGAETERALETMDAAIMVLTADPPLSASERQLLARVAAAAVQTFVVVNKADQLEPGEVAAVVSFVTELVCSARPALRARAAGREDTATGLPELESALSHYLAAGRRTGLRESVCRKADRLSGRALDGLRIRLSLAGVHAEEADRRAAEFGGRLETIRGRRTDVSSLVRVGVDRMLAELNEAAALAEAALADRAVADLRDWILASGADLPTAELRRAGRERLGPLARELVEPWRSQCQRQLRAALARLEDRLLDQLDADLADLSAAVQVVLGVDIVGAPDRSRLVDNPDFSYQLGEQVGWEEWVTASLRRRFGSRRQVAADLLAEADRLTRQQVGRVRADLQARLADSGRDLTRAVAQRFDAAADVVRRAVAASAHDRDLTADGARDLTQTLLPRVEELMTLQAAFSAQRPTPV
jgi:Elongation factor Tu GTP binding domain